MLRAEVRSSARSKELCTLEEVARNERSGCMHGVGLMLSLPLQAVVEFKWETWCKRLLWIQLAVYLVWLFAFTAFCQIFQACAATCEKQSYHILQDTMLCVLSHQQLVTHL